MIYYHKKGKINAPVVLLIHGYPNDSSTWDNLVPALGEQYQLILPDLPGAGASPVSSASLTMEAMARSIKEIMDHEGLEQAIVAGHSMGGYTALQFAALFPERVKGISLIHSLASADSEEKKENRKKAINLINKGLQEQETFLRGMAQNLCSASFLAAHPDVVKDIVSRGMKLTGKALTDFYEAIMNRTDHRPLLHQAAYPIQWIIGSEDTATPMKDALEQCYLAPVNQVSVYTPCGHMSMIEAPERLKTDLASFFNYCYSK
jgi:pimeloyl-ACP methyl ester carboxylesterase